MITVTLQYANLHEAHAALGILMATSPAVVEEVLDSEVEPKPKAKAKRKTKVKPAEPIAPPTPDQAKDGEDLQNLRAGLQQYAQKHGFQAAQQILVKFRIKRLPELQESQYDDFAAALEEAPAK